MQPGTPGNISPIGLPTGNPSSALFILETQTVRVLASASQAGRFETSAAVTHQPRLCTTLNIIAPVMALLQRAPEEALICEEIPLQIVVANSGAQARAHCARNVQASAQLQMQGIPAIRLEVVDENDPVPCGSTT